MNRIMRRPMFRKGGSAGEGITSGLRQGYQDPAGTVQPNDLSKINIGNLNMQQLRDVASQMAYKAPPLPRDRSLDDFKIDFGLDLISRSPSGNIFQTAGLAAKEPFKNFRSSRGAYDKSVQDRAINKYNAEANMFKTLIEAQSDVLGGSAGKSYRDLEIAKQLESIIPEIYKLEAKQRDGTITDEENIQLDVLKTQKNNFTKSNPVTEGAIDIFVNQLLVKIYLMIYQMNYLKKTKLMELISTKVKTIHSYTLTLLNKLKKYLDSFQVVVEQVTLREN